MQSAENGPRARARAEGIVPPPPGRHSQKFTNVDADKRAIARSEGLVPQTPPPGFDPPAGSMCAIPQPVALQKERHNWLDSEGKPRPPDWMSLRRLQKDQEIQALAKQTKAREEIIAYAAHKKARAAAEPEERDAGTEEKEKQEKKHKGAEDIRYNHERCPIS